MDTDLIWRNIALDRKTVSALNNRMLENLLNGTTDLAREQTRLAADIFYCPDRHAVERRVLFMGTPQPVAFSAELPEPCSFLALDVLDVPVLITRNESGELGAFVNACAHRGASVARGSGQRRSLVCPFHGWTYNLDGSLRGRPEDDCFSTPQDDCALLSLPVSEKSGIVMLGLGNTVSQGDVDSALGEIEQEIKSFELQRYKPIERRQLEVQANWKLVNFLSLESYHFKTLHRDSVAHILRPNAVVDTYDRHSRWAFPLQTIESLQDLNEKDWPDALQGSCTYTVYPGVMFIFNAMGAQMIRAEPGITPGESLPVAEECQRGLAAGKRDLLLGRNEPLLQFWHRLWQEGVRPSYLPFNSSQGNLDIARWLSKLHGLHQLPPPLATFLNYPVPDIASIGHSGVADAVHDVILGFISHAHI
jgi:nitrite reductase/ring-hydroxylating ferredoxin subunit